MDQSPSQGMPAAGVFVRSGRRALLAGSLVFLSACASVPRKAAVDSLGPDAEPATRLTTLVGSYDETSRNRWIEFNLIRIDEEYFASERRLQALKTRWNVGSSAAALLFNVASSLTNSAGVKANYVAYNSLAVGGNAIVSKEEFLEQSVNTLISAMEGRRAETRKRVRIGMSRPIGEYTLSDAYYDLLEYDKAGTLVQGISFAAEATKKESQKQAQDARDEIKRAVLYSEDERQLSFCISESLDFRPIDKDALARVLDQLKVDYAPGADVDALVEALSVARDAAPASFQRDVREAMETNKLMQPCRKYQ
jgi:hypothetical protein